MSIKTIAIIGCGAAATTFFRTLVDECIANQHTSINIIIFERGRELGPGLAYQSDHESLLINRPVQNMSANPLRQSEYYDWLKQKRFPLDEARSQHSEPIYTSRKTFGLYLNELFEKTIIKASQHDINTKVIYENVTQVFGTHSFVIETNAKNRHFADAIILCTGHNQPKDIYQLQHTPKYVNTPYPLSQHLSKINTHDQVGIIGNSLTAVDIVVALQKSGFLGKMHLFSRKYIVPQVRGLIRSHQPQFLTLSNIKKMLEEKYQLTLRDILRLFRKETRPYSISWKSLFKEDDINKPFHEILQQYLSLSNQENPWQSIIPSTNTVSYIIWNNLINRDKALFLKYCHRNWLNHRSSIPPVNARLLINLANQNRLSMLSGIQDISYCKNLKKYTVHTEKSGQFKCDWVINATGPSKYIQPEDGLLYEMIKHGAAREHRFGGVEVDFETSALINFYGHPNPRIRLIGHNTIGALQYTSSLELIAKKSMHVAKNFVTFMKEIANDQIKTPTFTTVDRISRFTQTVH